MITKTELDKLVKKYETFDFIKDDPIQFPHKFKRLKDIEIAGFIASLFAYGNRKLFIKKLDEIFFKMENEPQNFVENFDPNLLKGINYRFSKDYDIIEIFNILKDLYNKDGGLSELFEYSYNSPHFLQTVVDYFYARVKNPVEQGFYHMIPNPKNNGAMKRMWMYLRWMIRDGEVDLGIWDFMKKSELKIPLDIHVARISREMELLNRSSNDNKAVKMLTERLKEFDATDPIKYDFAMFGYSINKGL